MHNYHLHTRTALLPPLHIVHNDVRIVLPATSPSIKTRGKDLYLSVPSGRTIVLGRAVEGARYAEDTLDLFELADSVAADQGPTGTAATLRKEIEEAVTTAVQQAGTNLDTAKSDLEAAIAVATKASEDAAAQLATTVAEKAASTEKALTAAAADTKTAIEAAGKASAKERASIADDVKELSGLLQAVLDCRPAIVQRVLKRVQRYFAATPTSFWPVGRQPGRKLCSHQRRRSRQRQILDLARRREETF